MLTLYKMVVIFKIRRIFHAYEHKDEGKNEGVMLSEIGYIKSSIDRIEKSLNHLEERYTDLSNRLVKVEESTKNAHKRITELHDEIKGGQNHE